jgi:hypothetical protein
MIKQFTLTSINRRAAQFEDSKPPEARGMVVFDDGRRDDTETTLTDAEMILWLRLVEMIERRLPAQLNKEGQA